MKNDRNGLVTGAMECSLPVEALPKLLSHSVRKLFCRWEIKNVDEVFHDVTMTTPPMWLIPEPLHGLLIKLLSISDVEPISELCGREEEPCGEEIS